MREMYWYDIMLIATEYHEMMEENEKNNIYKDDFEKQKSEITSKFSNMNTSHSMPSIPNMSSITSGFKMPSL